MKILKIRFNNAKLFSYNKNNKDFICNFNVRKKRDEQKMFKQPITVFQISNMLHKIFGERPVPSFRYTFYKKNDIIFNIANNSYLKINNFKIYNKYKKRDEYPTELMQVKKNAGDSWSKTPIIFWAKIKKYLKDDYNLFIEKFNKITNTNVQKKPFLFYGEYFKNKVLNENEQLFLDWIKKIKKTPIYNFLLNDKNKINDIVQNINIIETVKNGISNVTLLSGIIYVPIEDEKLLDNIIYNTVTILDGGLVTIDDILYSDELSNYELDDFIKVSEINTDKNFKIIY